MPYLIVMVNDSILTENNAHNVQTQLQSKSSYSLISELLQLYLYKLGTLPSPQVFQENKSRRRVSKTRQ